MVQKARDTLVSYLSGRVTALTSILKEPKSIFKETSLFKLNKLFKNYLTMEFPLKPINC